MTPLQTFGANAAPSNMQFPTAAYLQASQNAAEMRMRGQEALGKGIASGITAAASAYGDYKKMQSSIKASEKGYDTFKDFLDPEVRNGIDAKIEAINKDTSLSLQDKVAFWEQAKGFIGSSINQNFALQKQQNELANATDRALLSENAGIMKQNAILQNQIDLENLRTRNKAFEEGSFTLPPSYGTGGAQPRSSFYNQQYR